MRNTERTLGTLKRVANAYAPDSEEYVAIEKAAQALLYIKFVEIEKEFEVYLDTCGRPISDREKMILAQMKRGLTGGIK